MRLIKTAIVSGIIAMGGFAISSSVFALNTSPTKPPYMNTKQTSMKAATVPATKAAPQSATPKGF